MLYGNNVDCVVTEWYKMAGVVLSEFSMINMLSSLPSSVTSLTSVTAFWRRLKSDFLAMFWPGLCCSVILILCIMLDSKRVLFIVKCSCIPRIL